MSANRKPFYEKNPFIFLLPFLILYFILIFVFAEDSFWGDEERYLSFAENLTNGFYSPLPPDIDLTNGPGYPIILAPLKAIDAPLILFKLLNAVFLYLAVVYFYKTLLLFIKQKTARNAAVLAGLYFPLFKSLPYILTEAFSVFLITLFMYSFCSYLKEKNPKLIKVLIPSFLLGYLALTKIIFGYVISAGIIIFFLYSIAMKSKKARLTSAIFILALLFCVPYLIYTYSLTGEIFYWGSGGEVMYWMSTLNENEYGDFGRRWLDESLQKKDHHGAVKEIYKLNLVEQKKAFQKMAIENIKKNPKKYIMNWFANIGRILFFYPHSYRLQTPRTYFTVLPNMFIVVFCVLFSFVTLKNRRKIPQEIFLLLTFISIYLFGSSLVSASRRMFFLALPAIGLWLAFVFDNFIHIDLDKKP